MQIQLHEGFKKLSLKPTINFSREDFDEFINYGLLYYIYIYILNIYCLIIRRSREDFDEFIKYGLSYSII